MFIKWYMVLIIDVNCRWLLQGGVEEMFDL